MKGRRRKDVSADLANVLAAARPEIVITHSPADKHDTHVAVLLRTVEAIRSLPKSARPKRFFGGETWRDLDWMVDSDKVAWDVSANRALQLALIRVYRSQVQGGKRYDLAAMGRRHAHATFSESHRTDVARALSLGMDLTPLIHNEKLSVADYVESFVERFRRDVRQRIRKLE